MKKKRKEKKIGRRQELELADDVSDMIVSWRRNCPTQPPHPALRTQTHPRLRLLQPTVFLFCTEEEGFEGAVLAFVLTFVLAFASEAGVVVAGCCDAVVTVDELPFLKLIHELNLVQPLRQQQKKKRRVMG